MRAGPTRRKRGWFRVLIGLVMIVAGVGAVAVGIAGAVGARDGIEDDAVARAPLGQPVGFEAAEPAEYTVYVIFGGRFGNSMAQERVIGRSGCEVSTGARFSGSRQGTSVTLGQASTIGRFDAPAGEVSVVCAAPSTDDYVVTPGGTGIFKSVIAIIAGALVAIGGILLFIFGPVGRRVPA